MNATVETQNKAVEQLVGADIEGNRGYITPPANISATQNEYLLEVDMPGVDNQGLEVSVEASELVIIGRRKTESFGGEPLYCESPLADYRRVFELGPDIDTSKISAEMQQGVLKLHLPKSEKTKPKRIDSLCAGSGCTAPRMRIGR